MSSHRPSSTHSPIPAHSPSRSPRRGAASTLALALAAVLTLGLLAACQPASGPERVTALRDTYEATLNSFNVVERPMEVEESEMAAEGDAEAEGEGEGADAAEETADQPAAGDEGEEGTVDEVVEEVPVRQDVMLDIILRKTGGGGQLDGVTLDVYQVDADEQDKANYRIYVDTAGLNKGSRNQISHVIEDVDFADGDKFAIAVRANVPPELYSEYKEYSDAGAGEEGSEG